MNKIIKFFNEYWEAIFITIFLISLITSFAWILSECISYISNNGLKSIIEPIWYGVNNTL